MKVPDLDNITDSRVALRMTKAISTNDPTYEKYETDDGLANFEIRDAFEVRMMPAEDGLEAETEPVKIDFTWEIIKFEPYEAQV